MFRTKRGRWLKKSLTWILIAALTAGVLGGCQKGGAGKEPAGETGRDGQSPSGQASGAEAGPAPGFRRAWMHRHTLAFSKGKAARWSCIR